MLEEVCDGDGVPLGEVVTVLVKQEVADEEPDTVTLAVADTDEELEVAGDGDAEAEPEFDAVLEREARTVCVVSEENEGFELFDANVLTETRALRDTLALLVLEGQDEGVCDALMVVVGVTLTVLELEYDTVGVSELDGDGDPELVTVGVRVATTEADTLAVVHEVTE